MGLADRIPGIRRLVRKPEQVRGEAAPVATQYIIRDSRGNEVDLGKFIGQAAAALDASTGDQALRTVVEIVRNPAAFADGLGADIREVQRMGSLLLFRATDGQVVTRTLREMVEEQTAYQAEIARRDQGVARHKGIRGKIRKIFDDLDPFVEAQGW